MDCQNCIAAVAGQGDELRAALYAAALREKALALAGLHPAHNPPGMTAVDVGAGTGFVTEALLAAGLEVFAVDAAPEMLAQLRATFAAHVAAGRLTVLQAGAERLPLPLASADAIFANMLLHHAGDPAASIVQMARVLKPGGRLVITDLDAHEHGSPLAEHPHRWPGLAREDVAGWLDAAGLRRVRVEDVGERCRTDSCCGADKAAVSIFAAVAERPVCGVRPALADAEAAAAHARGCWQAKRPLLCAESVLSGVAAALGVRSPLVPRLATGFCSGMSRTLGLCGAYSAGVMAIGLALGRGSGADELDDTYLPVQEFREAFLQRFGALTCPELTGHDLGSAEGLAAYRAQGLKTSLCAPLLEEAARLAVRILNGTGR
jgi:C_GCAxxG_C_C family probable redox protein